MTNYRINCMCKGITLRAYEKKQSRDFEGMHTKWFPIGYYCNSCNRFYSNGFIKWVINFKKGLSYKTVTVFSFNYKEYIENLLELQRLTSLFMDKIRDIRKKHTRDFSEYYFKDFAIKSLNNFKRW